VTPSEVTTCLAALVAAYPPVTMSAETEAIYTTFLRDVDAKTGYEAVATWIATSDPARFPRISELRKACERIAGNGPPDVDRVLAEVQRAVHKVGAYRVPHWSHPAIADAVEAIGWSSICASEEPEILRAQFRRAYEGASQRHRDPAARALAKEIAGSGPVLKQLTNGKKKS